MKIPVLTVLALADVVRARYNPPCNVASDCAAYRDCAAKPWQCRCAGNKCRRHGKDCKTRGGPGWFDGDVGWLCPEGKECVVAQAPDCTPKKWGKCLPAGATRPTRPECAPTSAPAGATTVTDPTSVPISAMFGDLSGQSGSMSANGEKLADVRVWGGLRGLLPPTSAPISPPTSSSTSLYRFVDSDSCDKPLTESACQEAATSLGKNWQEHIDVKNMPRGCYLNKRENKLRFNLYGESGTNCGRHSKPCVCYKLPSS